MVEVAIVPKVQAQEVGAFWEISSNKILSLFWVKVKVGSEEIVGTSMVSLTEHPVASLISRK